MRDHNNPNSINDRNERFITVTRACSFINKKISDIGLFSSLTGINLQKNVMTLEFPLILC